MVSVSTSFVPKGAKKIFATAAVALLSSSDVNLSCHGSDLAESPAGRVYGLKLSFSRASTGETPEAKRERLNREYAKRVDAYWTGAAPQTSDVSSTSTPQAELDRVTVSDNSVPEPQGMEPHSGYPMEALSLSLGCGFLFSK
jgi:hypothetical protein